MNRAGCLFTNGPDCVFRASTRAGKIATIIVDVWAQLLLCRGLAIGSLLLGRPHFLGIINQLQLHEAGGLLCVGPHLAELGYSHTDEQANDGHHDHDFHQCETGCAHFFGLHFLRRIHVFAGSLVTKPRRLSTLAVVDKPRILPKVAPLGQALGLLGELGQIVAPYLVVVPQIDAPIGKCRVRPNQHSPADLVGRFDELGPTDFLVAAWPQVGDDQLPKVVRQKISVTLLYREHVPPTDGALPS